MSAIAAAARVRRRRPGLPPLARPYHSLVLAGAAAIALALQTMRPEQRGLFAVLAVAASAAQLFVVRNGAASRTTRRSRSCSSAF